MARFRSGIQWKLTVAGGVVLIAAIVLAASFGGDLVGAQTSNGTPTTGASTTPSTQTAQYPAIVTELANQLGIDPAKVEAALEQVIGQQALNGKFNRGGFFGNFFGRFGHGPMIRGRANTILNGALQSQLNSLASFFGETAPSLRSELSQGLTLAQIAQKHGKTTDELKTFLTNEFQNALDQLINHSFTGKQAAPSTPATPSAAATPAM